MDWGHLSSLWSLFSISDWFLLDLFKECKHENSGCLPCYLLLQVALEKIRNYSRSLTLGFEMSFVKNEYIMVKWKMSGPNSPNFANVHTL